MVRFTYITESNDNGVIYTIIEETNGIFVGHTAEQVAAVAEQLNPNYQSHNFSSLFSDIYFNYCVRRLLSGESIPNTYVKAFGKID